MENFKKIMTVNTTGTKVYDALTKAISKWWTEMFEGASNEVGQSFTIRFGTNIFKKMTVKELVPNNKVVWIVTDSIIDIPELKNKKEWTNTTIIWEITSHDNNTVLHLTHEGLTPTTECYKICDSGWQFFTGSLTDFITTGIGKPFKSHS